MENADKNQLTIVILTAVEVEFKAVVNKLNNIKHVECFGRTGTEGIFMLSGGESISVIVIRAERGNAASSSALLAAIIKYQPVACIFSGIAGSINSDLKIGDILVPNYVHDYRREKGGSEQKPRPRGGPIQGRLKSNADIAARCKTWKRYLDNDHLKTCKNINIVTEEAIASGEVLLAEDKSKTYEYIIEHFNDTRAVDMESAGFIFEKEYHRSLDFLIVRGMSDDALNRDAKKEVKLAAEVAAAFSFDVIDRTYGNAGNTLSIYSFIGDQFDPKIITSTFINSYHDNSSELRIDFDESIIRNNNDLGLPRDVIEQNIKSINLKSITLTTLSSYLLKNSPVKNIDRVLSNVNERAECFVQAAKILFGPPPSNGFKILKIYLDTDFEVTNAFEAEDIDLDKDIINHRSLAYQAIDIIELPRATKMNKAVPSALIALERFTRNYPENRYDNAFDVTNWTVGIP
jgi:nucleoside phosphorylase